MLMDKYFPKFDWKSTMSGDQWCPMINVALYHAPPAGNYYSDH